MGKGRRRIPREIKIGAIADYLVGRPVSHITWKWGVADNTLRTWMRGLRDHFKSRYKVNNPDK